MKKSYKYHLSKEEMIVKDVAKLWADEDKKRGLNSTWQHNYRALGKLIERKALKTRPYTSNSKIKVLNVEEAMNIYNEMKQHEEKVVQMDMFEILKENKNEINETNINIIIDAILVQYNKGKLDKEKTGELLKELIKK